LISCEHNPFIIYAVPSLDIFYELALSLSLYLVDKVYLQV